MPHQRLLEQLPSVLKSARTNLAEENRPPAGGKPAFTIALSREAGINCSAIAHGLGKQLGWPVYDHELVEQIADDMGLQPSQVERVDERSVRWLVDRLETFLARPAVSEPAYMKRLIATLLSLAARGRCVVVGRGSPHLLPPETTMRMPLVAPLASRLAEMAGTDKISKEEAAQRLEQIDRERTSFVQHHFGHDPADPHHYDLIVNSARLSTANCAGLIADALRRFGGSSETRDT